MWFLSQVVPSAGAQAPILSTLWPPPEVKAVLLLLPKSTSSKPTLFSPSHTQYSLSLRELKTSISSSSLAPHITHKPHCTWNILLPSCSYLPEVDNLCLFPFVSKSLEKHKGKGINNLWRAYYKHSTSQMLFLTILHVDYSHFTNEETRGSEILC